MRTRVPAEPIPPEIDERCKRVLAIAYRGIHHVPYWGRRKLWGNGIAVTIAAGLDTYDFDVLTRLVVAAHDECVRVEIDAGGPRQLKLYLHPRKREGAMYERHPTMEAAVAAVRAGNVPARETP